MLSVKNLVVYRVAFQSRFSVRLLSRAAILSFAFLAAVVTVVEEDGVVVKA